MQGDGNAKFEEGKERKGVGGERNGDLRATSMAMGPRSSPSLGQKRGGSTPINPNLYTTIASHVAFREREREGRGLGSWVGILSFAVPLSFSMYL